MDIRDITKYTQMIQVYLFIGPYLLGNPSLEAPRVFCWSASLYWLHLSRTAWANQRISTCSGHTPE